MLAVKVTLCDTCALHWVQLDAQEQKVMLSHSVQEPQWLAAEKQGNALVQAAVLQHAHVQDVGV